MLSNNAELNDLWQRVKTLMENLPPSELAQMKRASAISFTYGNLKLSGWEGTMEDVEKEYDRLYGQ